MAELQGVLPYALILLSASVASEFAGISASVLVAQGWLDAESVFLSCALGAAIGDQAYFYLFRAFAPRPPTLDRSLTAVVPIRLAPGMRIARIWACAGTGVSSLTFSVVNLLSALVWAAALIGVVAWGAPAALAGLGLAAWKASTLVGLMLLVLSHARSKRLRRQRRGPLATASDLVHVGSAQRSFE